MSFHKFLESRIIGPRVISTKNLLSTFQCKISACQRCLFLMEEFTTIWLKQHYSLTNHVEIAPLNCSLNKSTNPAILKVFCYVVYLEKQKKKKKTLEIYTVRPIIENLKIPFKSSSTS